ncbi:uncharacterized protein LOC142977285 [Anticarsia gemmatalis]|uniref:uncharacterized protein LOC142977285 n=1 Tax=Anticarsia gemmatalis TaxID=129554 RepID=UPI003F7684DE
MMGDAEQQLKVRHSFCSPPQPPRDVSQIDNCCKSDIDVLQRLDQATTNRRQRDIVQHLNKSLGEYYKKYEHDEVPVKESTLNAFATIQDRGSLTNSELDKLEMKIFRNISQELQTEHSSLSSLESNIKFFKTTVQEIFDNFYASMRDFELYKKRFHEILSKNQEDAVADMEDFIKDMIQHIMSSESSISHDSKRSYDSKSSDTYKNGSDVTSYDIKDNDTYVKKTSYLCNHDNPITPLSANTISDAGSRQPVVEAYKNVDYCTDSTGGESKLRKSNNIGPSKEEIFNIYLLSGNPYVQIKMNDRNLLSEINIKEPCKTIGDGKYVASAENMRRVAAKKMELEKYVEQERENDDGPDREIPVKVSYAKKNIYLNEDFTQEHECEKSFISKICNYLCKKFRKAA